MAVEHAVFLFRKLRHIYLVEQWLDSVKVFLRIWIRSRSNRRLEGSWGFRLALGQKNFAKFFEGGGGGF